MTPSKPTKNQFEHNRARLMHQFASLLHEVMAARDADEAWVAEASGLSTKTIRCMLDGVPCKEYDLATVADITLILGMAARIDIHRVIDIPKFTPSQQEPTA